MGAATAGFFTGCTGGAAFTAGLGAGAGAGAAFLTGAATGFLAGSDDFLGAGAGFFTWLTGFETFLAGAFLAGWAFLAAGAGFLGAAFFVAVLTAFLGAGFLAAVFFAGLDGLAAFPPEGREDLGGCFFVAIQCVYPFFKTMTFNGLSLTSISVPSSICDVNSSLSARISAQI